MSEQTLIVPLPVTVTHAVKNKRHVITTANRPVEITATGDDFIHAKNNFTIAFAEYIHRVLAKHKDETA